MQKQQLSIKTNPLKTKILIIGGGVAGVGTALELQQQINANGYKSIEIILVEANKLLSWTSDRTPGRAGFGFHYKHLLTAKMYLLATLNLALKYQPAMVGGTLPHKHPLKRGRYFITKDSQETEENLFKLYEELKNEYAKFVKKHPEITEVFGEVKDFYRKLDPEEYENDVEMDKVVCGIETAEQLLDWPAFKKFLLNKIKKSDIKVFENSEVTDITYNHFSGDGYIATINKDNTNQIYANFVVNATWERIEELDRRLNFLMTNTRTNRLKAIAVVELPPELRNKHSMFFCMGPHCMFSNMGLQNDGKWKEKWIGLMTYAPKTNIDSNTQIELSEITKKVLTKQVSIELIGMQIKDGVSKYIQHIDQATLLETRAGIVKSLGEVDIFDHNSKVHERDYLGLEEKQIGYITTACMKLLYIDKNAQFTTNLLMKHIRVHDKIMHMQQLLLTNSKFKYLHEQNHKKSFLIYTILHGLTIQTIKNEMKKNNISQDQVLKKVIEKTFNTELSKAKINKKILTLFSSDHKNNLSSNLKLKNIPHVEVDPKNLLINNDSLPYSTSPREFAPS